MTSEKMQHLENADRILREMIRTENALLAFGDNKSGYLYTEWKKHEERLAADAAAIFAILQKRGYL